MKKINPNLKTIFSIGGAADNTGDIGLIADDPTKLENMAQSAIDMCKEYNYDGIDVDWEYPNKKVIIQFQFSFRNSFDIFHKYLI